jgi:putative membrane protein
MPSESGLGRLPPPPPPPRTGGSSASPADPPVAAAPDTGDFSQPRRLHPASVLLGVPVAQAAQALIFPIVATLAAPPLFTIVALTGFAILALIVRALDWQMRTFSFDGEVLRVDHGVLSRNHRSLDVSRIQQVEIQRGAIQRLFGLAAIRVETAGSASEPEVDLRVLPEADAVALRTAVRVSQDQLTGRGADGSAHSERTAADAGVEVLRVPMRHVVIAALTGVRLLVLPAVIGGALQFIGNQVGPFIDDALDRLIELGIAGEAPTLQGPDWRLVALGVAVVLALAMAAAVAVGVLRDGNFRIRQVGEDLHISRGLLSTRDSVVPLRRVQLVEIQRNWARRTLGYATVRIRSAGGSTGGEGRVTVPLLPNTEVDRLISCLLPNVDGVPALHAHPPAALRRALFRWLRPAALLLAAAYLLPEIVGVLDTELVRTAQPFLLLLLPTNTALALVEYRQLAHGATPRVVAARSGALSISTVIAPVVKVQALTSRRSLFQRRLGLTTLHAHVAGPGAVITVLDAGCADAAQLHARLTEHAASPIPVVAGTDTAGEASRATSGQVPPGASG